MTVYIEHMTAWYDLKTHNEVINLKFFSKITKSVGTAGLTGLDRLFSFMIVTELQVCFLNSCISFSFWTEIWSWNSSTLCCGLGHIKEQNTNPFPFLSCLLQLILNPLLQLIFNLLLVFWVVTPCGLVGRCQHFGGTLVSTYKSTWCYYPEDQHWQTAVVQIKVLQDFQIELLQLQPWRWRQYIPPKRWYLPTSPHGVTTQKISIDIFTAVRTSNHIIFDHTWVSWVWTGI
jgi:hypothetical protein